MKVKIYQKEKSPMQSGKALNKWVLEYIEEENSRHNNGIMGWISCENIISQIKINFSSKQEAVDYAISKNLEFVVLEPRKNKLEKKSYSDNFL